MGDMFSIGEFSMATGLTVKTLRFYHEEGLLLPTAIDPQTGYRYYDLRQMETARVITFLRSLDLPVSQIKEILQSRQNETMLAVLDRHKTLLAQKIKQFKKAQRSLEDFLAQEKETLTMTPSDYEVQEKVLPPVLIAGVRMQGRYSDCGKGFAKIGHSFGRYLTGKPLLLHHDAEYKEEDANFEACIPVRQAKTVEGIAVQELPGGRCVTLIHKGPYDQMSRSYGKIMRYIKDNGYKIVMPTREVYLKGPGMIFKGNPKNYLTEIEILVEQ